MRSYYTSKIKIISFILLIFILPSCINNNSEQNILIPKAPDYKNTTFWYGNNDFDPALNADIFYVYPTLGTTPVDEDGNRIYFSDIYQESERSAAKGNIAFNKIMYADTTFNFFAPYYRQVTMDMVTLPTDSLEERITTPYEDISNAFAEYLESYNNGRPFILLGHSQGSNILLRLIKDMKQDNFDNMIAAYTFGWKISQEEIDDNADRIFPAKGEKDMGVIICYNSISDKEGVSPVINKTDVCINPLNWKTDTTFASKELHMGTLIKNRTTNTFDTVFHYTSVYIKDNFLVASDVDPAICYHESLKEVFPYGNIHFMDSYLYGFNIRKNMRVRLEEFYDSKK